MNWLNELQSSIAYIEAHLEEDISKEVLAGFLQVPYPYYQRIFTMLCGMTPMQYIRNRRLSVAVDALRKRDETILQVAMRYRYENEESFRKAFTRFHGCTPSQAREEKTSVVTVTPIHLRMQMQGASSLQYRVVDLPALSLQVHAHSFVNDQAMYRQAIPMFWQAFFPTPLYPLFCEQRKQASHIKRILGIDTIALHGKKAEILYGAAVECEQTLLKCQPYSIPAHTWIIFRTHGAMPSCIQQLWTQIYTEFFPHPFYDPCMEIHMEAYDPSDSSLAEIYIPVKRKEGIR